MGDFPVLLHIPRGELRSTTPAISEAWHTAGMSQVDIWDVHWMMPSTSCGLGIALCSTALACEYAWRLNFAEFQRRVTSYFTHGTAPPMREVWFHHILHRFPELAREDVPSGDAILQYRCRSNLVLYVSLYMEYLLDVAPTSLVEEWAAGRMEVGTQVHHTGDNLLYFQEFPPLAEALNRVNKMLAILGTPSPRQEPLRADLVIGHCREELDAWLYKQLLLLDRERTMDMVGAKLRVFIYERCMPHASHEVKTQRGTVSEIHWVPLPHPQGYENVVYVFHILWLLGLPQLSALGPYSSELPPIADPPPDFIIFLHGAPGEHLAFGLLNDVFRSLAVGRYTVPFLQLNVKRLPAMPTVGCQGDMVRPLLEDRSLPPVLAAYCCSQFVVARSRLEVMPRMFWKSLWDRFSLDGDTAPATCREAQGRIRGEHWRGPGVARLWGVTLEPLWHWLLGEPGELPPREHDTRLPLFLRAPWRRCSAEGGSGMGGHSSNDPEALPDWGFDPRWGNVSIPRVPYADFFKMPPLELELEPE